MNLLLIAGNADDIFIYNYAKWLKASLDITIDVIELNDAKTKDRVYDYEYYNRVDQLPKGYFLSNIPLIRHYTKLFLSDWQKSHRLKTMLKGRFYDIIHCHLVGGLYAGADYLKNHCNKLFFTFWGGEETNKRYFGSNKLYHKKIRKILRLYSDGLINTNIKSAKYWGSDGWEPKCYHGSFGSSPLELIYHVLDEEGRENCKGFWDMPKDKFSVQLGYSGKSLHQYLEIIDILKKYEPLKSKIHLVAPMTRGNSEAYTQKVRDALENSGFSYTVIEKHLTDEEMAKLRCSIDIVLQLSTFDGYSRSIIEALCAKSVVIYGEWLKYQDNFKADGFVGYPVSDINSGVEKISELISKWEETKQICEENKVNGKSKYMWEECIKDWVAVYQGTAIPLN